MFGNKNNKENNQRPSETLPKEQQPAAQETVQTTAEKLVKREIVCGFCHNTIIFERVKTGQKIACPKCNYTLEIK